MSFHPEPERVPPLAQRKAQRGKPPEVCAVLAGPSWVRTLLDIRNLPEAP